MNDRNDRNYLSELHFTSLSTQSNMYGLSTFVNANAPFSILVAPTKGKIMCISFNDSAYGLYQEVPFTYIHGDLKQGDLEIIGIGAYAKHDDGMGLVIAIAFIREITDFNGETKRCPFLNIYSHCDQEYCGLNNIAGCCCYIELDFPPYYLSAQRLVIDRHKEFVFLLTGANGNARLIRERESSNEQNAFYIEDKSKFRYFYPEFSVPPLKNDIVMRFDIAQTDDNRITVFGCESGLICITSVDLSDLHIKKIHKKQFDSPVTSVYLFHPHVNQDRLDIVVTLCMEGVIIFSDIQKNYLRDHYCNTMAFYNSVWVLKFSLFTHNDPCSSETLLPSSIEHDCALACTLIDIDQNGQKELAIGTYGNSILFYRQPQADDDNYELKWTYTLPAGVLAMHSADVTGDGLQELIVLTVKGVNVLQLDIGRTADLILKQLRQFVK